MTMYPFPDGSSPGEEYTDADGNVYFWDGECWHRIIIVPDGTYKPSAGSGGGTGGLSGSTADRPSSAEDGTTYFDTDQDKLYVWNGSFWVDVT